MKVSLALVTHGRPDIVIESCRDVFASGLINEVVWVDNNSKRADRDAIGRFLIERAPDMTVWQNLENEGAARGLNRAFSLCTGDAILVTDGDITYPDNVLRDMVELLAADDRRAAVSAYVMPADGTSDRWQGEQRIEQTSSGMVVVVPAIPMISRLFRRDLLDIAGYMNEGFGLCEWDDVEWAYRAFHYARLAKRECLAIISKSATHLPDVGRAEDDAYRAAKQREFADPSKRARIVEMRDAGWPRFYPEYVRKHENQKNPVA